MQVSAAQQASSAQRSRQYSLQEVPFVNVKSIGSRGSVLMLAVRFEEVVSRGAGAAVALFSGAVIREMYRTKILSVKVCPPMLPPRCWAFLCVPPPPPGAMFLIGHVRPVPFSNVESLYCVTRCCLSKSASLLYARIWCLNRCLAIAFYHVKIFVLS